MDKEMMDGSLDKMEKKNEPRWSMQVNEQKTA